jgi:hypothetical protein
MNIILKIWPLVLVNIFESGLNILNFSLFSLF